MHRTAFLVALLALSAGACHAADDPAYAAELARRSAEDQARRAQTEAIVRKANEDQQRAEGAHEARMAKLKRECGADFQQPRVGMPLERAQRCVGDLKLYGQDGSASVYRAGRLRVVVDGGRIVRWAVL